MKNSTVEISSEQENRNLFEDVWRLLASPAVSYIGLLFIQLFWTWGIFSHREISAGDSTSYMHGVLSFLSGEQIRIEWVPLFHLAYAPFVALFQNNLPLAENALRFAVYLTNGGLALFILRRLLPGRQEVAWLCAVLFVLNPIEFDGLYEVHIFAQSIYLVALFLLGLQSPFSRAMACVTLMLSSLFLRNEFICGAGVVILFCLYLDDLKKNWRPYFAAVGLFILLSIGVFFLSRSDLGGIGKRLSTKACFQFGQGFAVYYSEMTPDYHGNPFLEYEGIVSIAFGKPVGPGGALLQNPSAMFKYFGHNVSRLPAGSQALLISPIFNKWTFEATSRRSYTACMPSKTVTIVAYTIEVGLLLLICSALIVALKSTFRGQFPSGGWLWVGLLSTLPVAIFSTLFQRPAPHYILPMHVTLVALAGFGFASIVRKRTSRLITIALIASLLFLPHYYGGVVPIQECQRPVADAISRLTLFKTKIIGEGMRLYAPPFCEEDILTYMGIFDGPEKYIAKISAKADDVLASEDAFNTAAAATGANIVYLSDWALIHPAFKNLKASGRMEGWFVVESGNSPTPWCLIVRNNEPHVL